LTEPCKTCLCKNTTLQHNLVSIDYSNPIHTQEPNMLPPSHNVPTHPITKPPRPPPAPQPTPSPPPPPPSPPTSSTRPLPPTASPPSHPPPPSRPPPPPCQPDMLSGSNPGDGGVWFAGGTARLRGCGGKAGGGGRGGRGRRWGR